MGGAVSAGEDNEELIDNLVDAGYIKDSSIQRVFRAVDRGNYYLPDYRRSAYKDTAWKNGNFHLSAPCIYAEVMGALQVEPSMSFLNLGSGTGYLSTLVGLLLGPYGVNHGIEQHTDVVEYAIDRLDEFLKQAKDFDEFEFCEPTFIVGNCLLLPPGGRLYDRVYCGAACPPEHQAYMKQLIKIGGILVMPLNDSLLRIRRVEEASWEVTSVLPVSFASLALPSTDVKHETVNLPDVDVLQLQDVCRCTVRQILRQKILKQNPGILKNVRCPRTPKSRRNRDNGPLYRLVTPDRTMISSRGDGSNDGDQADDDDSDSSEDGENFAMQDEDLAWHDILTLMRRRVMPDQGRQGDTDDPGYGGEEDNAEAPEGASMRNTEVSNDIENPDIMNGLLVDDQSALSSNSSSGSSTHCDTTEHLDNTHIQPTAGIPISDNRLRTTSMNSTSTSCTSGVGTSSSMECSSMDGTPDTYMGSHSMLTRNTSHNSRLMSTVNEGRSDVPTRSRNNGREPKRQALFTTCDDSSDQNAEAGGNHCSDSSGDSTSDASSDTSSDNFEDAICELTSDSMADAQRMMWDDGGVTRRWPCKKKAKADHKEEETGPTFQSLMFEMVDELPVPQALKNYLLFFRTAPNTPKKPTIADGIFIANYNESTVL